MKNVKKLLSAAMVVALFVSFALSAQAATYVSGNIGNTGKTANGSLSWTQATGTAKASTNASTGAGVSARLRVTAFKDAAGVTILSNYDSGVLSSTTNVSASKGSTLYKGFSGMTGNHTAIYGNGTWTGGTYW